MKGTLFSPDVQDFIKLLAKYDVRYVIIGGVAVIYYGSLRLTGDIDFLYEPSAENAEKLYSVLKAFWRDSIPGVMSADELVGEGIVVQFGVPPNRIDLLTSIETVTFKEVWDNRLVDKMLIDGKEYPVYFIGLEHLIKNKESVKRNKDIDDLKYLKKLRNNSTLRKKMGL